MLSYSGQFAAPASTGNATFTLTGCGFTPQAIIITTASLSSNNTISTSIYNSYGFATASQQCAIGISDEDGVSHGSNPAGYHTASNCVYAVGFTGTGVLVASLVSFGYETVTLNFTTTISGAYVNILALGGDGLTGAYIKQIQTPGSTGSVDYTSFGFQPDALIALGSVIASAPAASDALIGSLANGICDGSLNQICYGGYSENGPTNYSILYDGSFHLGLDSAGSITQRMTITAMGADGFTGNWNTSSASGKYLFVLGLKGVSAKVGKVAMRTSTGTTSITGAGFTPKSAFIMANGLQSGTSFTLANHHMMGFAGSTVGNAVAVTGYSGGLKNSNCRRHQNTNTIIRYGEGGTLAKEASLSSYDSGSGGGITISYSTANATAMDFGYMLLGGDEPTPSATASRLALMGVG
jgi:hypothetical protein